MNESDLRIGDTVTFLPVIAGAYGPPGNEGVIDCFERAPQPDDGWWPIVKYSVDGGFQRHRVHPSHIASVKRRASAKLSEIGGYLVLTLTGGVFREIVHHTTFGSAERSWREFHELGSDVDYGRHDPESDNDCLILVVDEIDTIEGDEINDKDRLQARDENEKTAAIHSARILRRQTRESVDRLREDVQEYEDALETLLGTSEERP